MPSTQLLGEKGGDIYLFDPNEFVVMQDTGLKDKNGKEIYEGDIVEEFGKYYEVIYKAPAFTLRDYKIECYYGDDDPVLQDWGESYVVVGNIYENPDLLTV